MVGLLFVRLTCLCNSPVLLGVKWEESDLSRFTTYNSSGSIYCIRCTSKTRKEKTRALLLRELSLSCEEGRGRRAESAGPNHTLAGETIQRPTLPRLCPPPLGPYLAQLPVRRLAQHRNHQAGACCLILELSPRALLEFSEFVSVWPCPWPWVAS